VESINTRRGTRKLVLLPLLGGLLVAGAAEAQLYRWVDADGNVHYSDQLPPQALQHDRSVLDSQGRTREQQRAMADQAAREQALKERAAREAEQRAREEQDRRDRNLLATYSQVEELEHVRDDRVGAIDAAIAVAEERSERLRRNVADYEQRVKQIEASGRQVPPDVLARLGDARRALVDNESYIDSQREERVRINQRFAADIARFKELRSMP
jgi:hypothetical protein